MKRLGLAIILLLIWCDVVMKDSLKKLLGKFPYFLNKEVGSNFYNSQFVTNERFRDIYQSMFDVVESFHLDKRCFIFREQTVDYEYVVNFFVNFPNLKEVICYKNDDVIYRIEYDYDDFVDRFEYSYSGNVLNDNLDGESGVIPKDKFRIKVETYDEIIVEKGYPENDVVKGDIYDHDISLDEIGAFLNVPRKKYLTDLSSDLYPATEPPYNNKETEDDYYYMKRMIEYSERLHYTPAPVLELWKLYGIESRMENRERLLLKVFDENVHDDLEWVPNVWEHKDKFCKYSQIEGIYFFVDYSTNTPTRIQNIDMDFILVNSYGDSIADDSYYFDIYIDGKLFEEGINSLNYSLSAFNIPLNTVCIIKVDCKDENGKLIGSVEFNVRIRSCDDADFFVSVNGNDNNDGKTKETPFKTLQKACNSLQSDNSLISVLKGEYVITNRVNVPFSCMIMGCGDVLIENTNEPYYFTLAYSKELELQGLKLKYADDIHMITIDKWTNKNITRPAQVIVREIDEYDYNIKSLLIKNLIFENEEIKYEKIKINNISDLDGVVYDLRYVNGELKYKEFEYVSDDLSPSDVDKLRNAVTSLTYEDNKIKFTVLGDEI